MFYQKYSTIGLLASLNSISASASRLVYSFQAYPMAYYAALGNFKFYVYTINRPR
jgi:hypothetical protein